MHARAIAPTLVASILLVAGLLVVGAACGGAAEPQDRDGDRRENTPAASTPAATDLPAPPDTPLPTPLAAPTPVPAPDSTPGTAPDAPTPESTAGGMPTPEPTPPPTPTPAPLVLGEGATSLHQALVGGEPSVVMAVLLTGGEAEINAVAEIVSPAGSASCCWTPLHVAAANPNPEVIAMLLERGADTAARTGDGRTPCDLAAGRLAGTPVHEQLCRDTAAAEAPTPTPQPGPTPVQAGPGREFSVDGVILRRGTPLHEAAATAGPTDIRDLLDRGADIHARVDVHLTASGTTHPGATALHIAAWFNPDPLVTGLLLDRGIDVDARTGERLTPMHVAALNNVPAVTDLLLQRGANAGAADGSGNTPCQMLQQNEHFTGGSRLETLCKLLGVAHAPTAPPVPPTSTLPAFRPTITPTLPAFRPTITPTPAASGRPGGAPAASDPWSFTGGGDTPLHRAALEGGPAEVRSLLDQGADIHAGAEMRFRDSSIIAAGWTPLHLAAWWNPDIAVTALLLARGAQIESRTGRGDTPLLGAARYNRVGVVVLLVEHGADVNAASDGGVTPLQYAAANEDPNVAALLLRNGADVNHRSNANATPLHGAATNSNPDVVALLLERGAAGDIEVATRSGRRPLHYALQFNSNPEVAGILVAYGADPQAQDSEGNTPCRLAQQNAAFTGHPVLDLLCPG